MRIERRNAPPRRRTTMRSATSNTSARLWLIPRRRAPARSGAGSDPAPGASGPRRAQRSARRAARPRACHITDARHSDRLPLAARQRRHRRAHAGDVHGQRAEHLDRLLLHRHLVERCGATARQDSVAPPRDPGRDSPPRPGCRTARGPGRRWRCRARSILGPVDVTGWPSKRISPSSGR